uniref:Uncharacterized protein n=1 Tax=Glossina pallidipes TaxID=7398 RepID=A0A1B0A6T4_GLOPL
MRNYVGDCELFNSGSSSSSNSTSAGVNSWRVVVLIKCNMWHNYKFTFNTNKALSNDAPVIVTPADSYLIMIKVKINNLTLCHINAGRSDVKPVLLTTTHIISPGGLAIRRDGLKTQQFAYGIHRLSENESYLLGGNFNGSHTMCGCIREYSLGTFFSIFRVHDSARMQLVSDKTNNFTYNVNISYLVSAFDHVTEPASSSQQLGSIVLPACHWSDSVKLHKLTDKPEDSIQIFTSASETFLPDPLIAALKIA